MTGDIVSKMELDTDGDTKLCSQFSSSSSSSSTKRISQDASTDSLHSPLPQQIHHLSSENQQQQRFNNWSLIVSQKFYFQPSLCQSYAQLQHSCSPSGMASSSPTSLSASPTSDVSTSSSPSPASSSSSPGWSSIFSQTQYSRVCGVVMTQVTRFPEQDCSDMSPVLTIWERFWSGLASVCTVRLLPGEEYSSLIGWSVQILFSDWLISKNTLLWLVEQYKYSSLIGW